MTGDHDHSAVADNSSSFLLAIALNVTYVGIEATFGFITGSLALLADAAHNMTDVAGLLIAWGATVAATRRPTMRHTYGLGRTTVLAALINGCGILAGSGVIAWEALHRFDAPSDLPAQTMLWVAAVGILVNVGTALLFLRRRKSDLNIGAAFLHMAGDAAVSVGVVAAAVVIMTTGWNFIDPLIAIAISAVVGWSAFGLLKSALHLTLDGTPEQVDIEAVIRYFRSLPGVSDIHDLHVWPLSTTSVALTVHLVMPEGSPGDGFLDDITEALRHRFGIAHATLQVESGQMACHLVGIQRF